LIPFPGSHTSESISSVLKDRLRCSFGVDLDARGTLLTLTTDHAGNMFNCGKDHMNCFSLGCAAHDIELAINDAIYGYQKRCGLVIACHGGVKELISTLSTRVTKFHQSPEASSALKEIISSEKSVREAMLEVIKEENPNRDCRKVTALFLIM